MAKYWVGGTGNTNDPTNHWATTSGGAPGAGNAPTAADDVFIDANSGAGTITVNAALACRSFNTAGSSIATLTHNAAIDITVGDATAGAGNVAVNLAGITTYNLGDALTSRWVFTSSNSANVQTINFNGKATGDWSMSTTSGRYQLTGGFTQSATSRITWSNPNLDFNGQTCTIGLFIATATNVRTLTLGAANITISGTGGNAWNIGNSANITISAGTSTLTFTGASPSFVGAGKTYYNVSHTGSTTFTISNQNTFNNLSRIGTAATTCTLNLPFGGTQTVNGVLTLTGNSVANNLSVVSGFATSAATISCANAPSLTNVYFTDITISGAAAPVSGTMLGDCGNNSGITFTSPLSVYRVAASAYNTTATWASSSGGVAGTGRIPLPQDTAVFDASSGTGTTNMNMLRMSGVNASASSACTINFNTASVSVFGSMIFGGSCTISGTQNVSMAGRANATLTSGGKTVTFGLTTLTYGFTTTFGDSITSTGTINQGGGTLDLGTGFTHTFTTYTSNNIGNLTRSLVFNNSVIQVSSTAATTVWNLASPTNYSVTPGTGAIVISTASANARIFTGGGKTYPTLTYTVAGSTGSLTISDGGNSFTGLNFSDVTNARTLTLTAATNNTVTQASALAINGTSGKLMTINSSSAGSAATLTVSNGTVNLDYLSVQDNTAAGSVPFYAGPNSTLVSGTTNWLAQAAPTFVPSFILM